MSDILRANFKSRLQIGNNQQKMSNKGGYQNEDKMGNYGRINGTDTDAVAVWLPVCRTRTDHTACGIDYRIDLCIGKLH